MTIDEVRALLPEILPEIRTFVAKANRLKMIATQSDLSQSTIVRRAWNGVVRCNPGITT